MSTIKLKSGDILLTGDRYKTTLQEISIRLDRGLLLDRVTFRYF